MRAMVMAVFLVICLTSSAALVAQTKTPATAATAQTPEDAKIKAYIALLRKDVRTEKAKLLGTVMRSSPKTRPSFGPFIDYDVELSKLNDMRVANIKEYAKS
jgi:hypothetical protein